MPRENENKGATQNDTQHENRDKHRVPDVTPRAHQWHMVKKLLKSKWKNNKRYYLVQWEDGSEPTWEPSNNISQFLKQIFHGTRDYIKITDMGLYRNNSRKKN